VIPPKLLCQQEGCTVEASMRALAAIRDERIKQGIADTKSTNDHWENCKRCGRTPGWSFHPGGLVKSLTGS